MPRSRSRTALTLVSTLAVPVLAIAVLFPGAASATHRPKPTKGTCTHLSGNAGIPGSPTLTGCSPSPNAPGTGTFTFPFAPTGTSTIHWANGSSTSFTFSSKVILPTKSKKVHGVSTQVANPKFHCHASDQLQAALKGKIPTTGNHNLPAGDTGLKGSVKATICVSTTFDVTLLAGTTFAL